MPRTLVRQEPSATPMTQRGAWSDDGPAFAAPLVRILVKVISDSGERDHVPRQRTLESATLL